MIIVSNNVINNAVEYITIFDLVKFFLTYSIITIPVIIANNTIVSFGNFEVNIDTSSMKSSFFKNGFSFKKNRTLYKLTSYFQLI